MAEIPYYRVHRKNNRAYWCPTKRMKARGFEVTALGLDGPEAQEAGRELTARWRSTLKERSGALGPRVEAPSAQNALRVLSHVYFVRVGERIKIGVSRNAISRVQEIAGHLPYGISHVLIVPGTRQDERRLHERFRRYRTRGEWFRACAALQLTITRCAAAGAVIHDDAELRTAGDRVESSPMKSVEAESNRAAAEASLNV